MSKEVFGTKEWAKYNMNCYHGCQHDCKYCYAKAGSVRQQRLIENWPNVELRKGMKKKGFGKRNGRIMFPSRHDIHPDRLK